MIGIICKEVESLLLYLQSNFFDIFLSIKKKKNNPKPNQTKPKKHKINNWAGENSCCCRQIHGIIPLFFSATYEEFPKIPGIICSHTEFSKLSWIRSLVLSLPINSFFEGRNQSRFPAPTQTGPNTCLQTLLLSLEWLQKLFHFSSCYKTNSECAFLLFPPFWAQNLLYIFFFPLDFPAVGFFQHWRGAISIILGKLPAVGTGREMFTLNRLGVLGSANMMRLIPPSKKCSVDWRVKKKKPKKTQREDFRISWICIINMREIFSQLLCPPSLGKFGL